EVSGGGAAGFVRRRFCFFACLSGGGGGGAGRSIWRRWAAAVCASRRSCMRPPGPAGRPSVGGPGFSLGSGGGGADRRAGGLPAFFAADAAAPISQNSSTTANGISFAQSASPLPRGYRLIQAIAAIPL